MRLDRAVRELVLPEPPLIAASAREFLEKIDALAGDATPIERALVGGVRADRLGFAFVSGYTSAVVTLAGGALAARGLSFPALRPCVAATEAGGAHPRAIATTLGRDEHGLRLDGAKRWVTLGDQASHALVIAREGELDGRPALKAVLVPLHRAGVRLGATPAPPFVPEIGHAELTLDAVRVDEDDVLPGDGYSDWLKPFRTHEDLSVHASLVGYLAGVVSRAKGPPQASAELVAIAILLDDLSREDAKSAETHVALEGAIALTQGFIERRGAQFAALPADARERWERDRPLLNVAGRARSERFLRALERSGRKSA